MEDDRPDVNENETIIFSLKNPTNDNLNKTMGIVKQDTSNNNISYVLLFVNDPDLDDLLLYSTSTNSYFELLDFGNYKLQEKINLLQLEPF